MAQGRGLRQFPLTPWGGASSSSVAWDGRPKHKAAVPERLVLNQFFLSMMGKLSDVRNSLQMLYPSAPDFQSFSGGNFNTIHVLLLLFFSTEEDTHANEYSKDTIFCYCSEGWRPSSWPAFLLRHPFLVLGCFQTGASSLIRDLWFQQSKINYLL